MAARPRKVIEKGVASAIPLAPIVGLEQQERHEGAASLPWDVLDKIQACLPTVHYFRCRLVCKRWRDNLGVPALREMHSRIGIQEQWILTFPYHDKVDNGKKLLPPYVHHPLSYRWHQWPVASVASKPLLGIFGVGEGLICFEEASVPDVDGATLNSIVVCDPLGNSRKLLPAPAPGHPAEHYEISVVGFDVSKRTRSYRVFAACICRDDQQSSTTIVFDSERDAWLVLGPWVENPSGYHFLRSVLCGKKLFLLRYTLSEKHERKYTLVMNNLDDGVWQEMPVNMPGELFCACPYLINYKGRILMIGVTPWDASEQASGKIWTLDTLLSEWVEVATAPTYFNGHLYPFSCFLGVDDLLYMQLNCSNQRMVTCDLSETPPSWRRLPPGPMFRNNWFSMPVVPGLDSFVPM